MQLITRGIVIASTVVAALAEVYLATEYARPVFWIAIVGFFALAAIGQQVRRVAMPLLMAAMYVMPAIYLIFRDGEDFSLDIIWILPLLGICLSGPGVRQWSLPARWQWPLVTWAMLAAISWPIVFLREADFALWILPLERVSNTSIGVSPWLVDLNVVYFVIGHNVGILLLDAMCRWYVNARDRFRAEVLSPMLTAAAISAAVAFYQGFFDLSFLNHHFWTYMIRAAGTMGDPNKLGAVCAFWTIGSVIYARTLRQPWRMTLTAIGLAAGIGAVWLSGSRTGLAAVIVSVGVAAIEALRSWWSTRSQSPLNIGRAAAAVVAAAVLATALILVLQRANTHTIVARGTLFYLPFIGDHTIAQTANEWLWERFGYGPAAFQMVKEHPIDGVGVGMFHTLVMDFGKVRGYSIPTDNAQNWFRHNLAEFGIVGIIPMLWWFVLLAMLMFSKSHGDPSTRSRSDNVGPTARSGQALSAALLRGVLIGFGVASTFGMPAQSIAIVMTFWVFTFWLLMEKGPPLQTPVTMHWPRAAIIAATALLAVHIGATTVDAFGDLRPRNRAQRFNWYYRYGYVHPDDVEKDPGGYPVGRRWTMKQSLAVIPVKGKVLKFVAWIDHPDADQKPVHTKVWADGALVYEGDLRRTPIILDIPATPGHTHMVLETSIDRLWRPREHGSSDVRELGLSIRDWVWE
jgi:hypothetical protein